MTAKPFQGLILVGLGPGDPGLLTRQAERALAGQAEIFTTVPGHPALASLPASVRITVLDAGRTASLESLEAALYLGELLDRTAGPSGLTVAVDGSPLEFNPIAQKLYNMAHSRQAPLLVLPGIGFGEYARSIPGLGIRGSLSLVDAGDLAARLVPPLPVTVQLLVCRISSLEILHRAATTLAGVYPSGHTVRLLHLTGDTARVEEATLATLQSRSLAFNGCLFVPPMREGASFEDFQQVIARLRAPDGCPWDREQTHLTLRRHLLEETYEALEALDNQDAAKTAEEFGDLLLQIVLHAQIASELKEFSMADILQGIHDKIVRRHPHVFGGLEVGGVDGVLLNWEKLKAKERRDSGEETRGILDGVPPALPSLTQAQEIQERAARVGFDWPDISGVLDKVREEIGELHTAESEDEMAWELGDLLFAVVNVSRWKKVDAETALRDATRRFRQRFAYIEHAARSRGLAVNDLSFEEMDRLWEAAKKE